MNKRPHLVLTIAGHDGRSVRITAKRYSTGTRFDIVEMAQLTNGRSVPSDNCATIDSADALRAAEFLIRAHRSLEPESR